MGSEPALISDQAVVLRILLAAILGGVIGLQRESVNRPAGFRTHVLVATGSTLIMLVSIYGFTEQVASGRFSDPARLAAQVVSGIGFLGAGTILKEGSTISGLTTAASLWVVSGIGLAVGAGFYGGAVVATALVYIALSSLGRLDERLFHRSQYQTVLVEAIDRPGQLGRIASCLGQHNVSIRNIRLQREENDEQRVLIRLQLKLPLDFHPDELLTSLLDLQGVSSVTPVG
jgi:putative Mg2+ transporter-C (MgtC) family protein